MTPYMRKMLVQAEHASIAEKTDTVTVLLRAIEERDIVLMDMLGYFFQPDMHCKIRKVLETP